MTRPQWVAYCRQLFAQPAVPGSPGVPGVVAELPAAQAPSRKRRDLEDEDAISITSRQYISPGLYPGYGQGSAFQTRQQFGQGGTPGNYQQLVAFCRAILTPATGSVGGAGVPGSTVIAK